VKLIFDGYFGHHVDLTQVEAGGGPELENACLLQSEPSHDRCQPASSSGEPGGYHVTRGAAGAPDGNLFVADMLNHRVQELTGSGRFVLMFGKQVNQTETAAKAGPALEDVCTAASKEICQAGVEGTEAGALTRPQAVAVDGEGNVYVAELTYTELGGGRIAEGKRVQKFTPAGAFIFEIGKEVNATKKTNLCTREEEEKSSVICGGATEHSPGSPYEWGGEAGAFDFEVEDGNILVADDPGNVLYVGDESRVQEFKPNGEPAGEFSLQPSGQTVRALAVDPLSGYLYLIYGEGTVVERRDAQGKSIGAPIEVSKGTERLLYGLAVDPDGRLAIVTLEREAIGSAEQIGELYEASTGRSISRFRVPPGGVTWLSFNGEGRLYAPSFEGPLNGPEIYTWTPVFVAEVTTGAHQCVPGPEQGSNVAEECTLEGTVNPEGVANLRAWFEWGPTTMLGERTPTQTLCTTACGATPSPARATITARPNAQYYYRLAGEDANSRSPEILIGGIVSLSTPLVVPRIVGHPSAAFLKSSSAVLSDGLNPENAQTEYFFEYATSETALLDCPGVKVKPENCRGVVVTHTGQSGVYGSTQAALEASGLQPDTAYYYRLAAESDNGTESKAVHGEPPEGIGVFTTAPASAPKARTNPVVAGAVGTTTATISGVVEPDGAPATYAFELGVYDGVGTQYGVVFSGSTGSATAEESLALTGLQPGTEYAYRIAISSGYIPNATHTFIGEVDAFTTSGAPDVLRTPQSLPILPVLIGWPPKTKPTTSCKHGYVRERRDKCVKRKPKHRKGKKAGKSNRRPPQHGRHN
jgi:hypothetical protein